MPSRSLSIKGVTPATPKHWSVKVQVVEKSPPRKAINGQTQFQRLILLDKEGTRVQASLFDVDIARFKNTFQVLHKYEISNATVKPIDDRHRVVENEYQWTINAKTPVVELHDDAEASEIIPVLHLVKFADFHKYVDSQSQVDVLGAVIDVLPEKQIRKKDQTLCDARELLIINDENKITKLTLWDHFVPNEGILLANKLHECPIILAMRIRVVSYDGYSLSTRGGSSFLIDPNLTEAKTLRIWMSLNNDLVEQSKQLRNYDSQERRSEILHHQIMKVSDIPAFPENGKLFAVLCNVSITNKGQSLWYMSCNTCFKGINTEYQTTFTCRYCNNTTTAEPRCRFEIEVTDDSGSIIASIFGKNAEKMFSLTAFKLMQDDVQANNLTPAESATTKQYLIRLKATHSGYPDTMVVRFNVVSVVEG